MENETLSLAPAAGSGVGKLLADELLKRPGFIQLLADVAEGGMRAMSPRRWDKETEKWINDPDFRVRVQTLALVLAHMEGEPIKRIIHQHLGGNGTIDPLAALQDSPALREAATRLIEKANWKTSGNAAHKRPRKVEEAASSEPAAGPVGEF